AERTGDDFVDEVRSLIQERDVFRKSAEEAVAAVEKELAVAKATYARVARMVSKMGAGVDEEDALVEQMQSAKHRQRAAEIELHKAQEFARSKEEAWTRLEGIIHESRNLAAAWDKAGPEERRILLD